MYTCAQCTLWQLLGVRQAKDHNKLAADGGQIVKMCMLFDPVLKKSRWPNLERLFLFKEPNEQVQRSSLADIPVGKKSFKAPDLTGADGAKAGLPGGGSNLGERLRGGVSRRRG